MIQNHLDYNARLCFFDNFFFSKTCVNLYDCQMNMLNVAWNKISCFATKKVDDCKCKIFGYESFEFWILNLKSVLYLYKSKKKMLSF